MVYKSNNSVYISGSCKKKKRTGTVSNVMTIVTLPVSCSMTDLEHKLLLEYALEWPIRNQQDLTSQGRLLQSQAI